MIIDFHAHIYPEKIAEKATLSISAFYENAPVRYHGHSEELIASGSKIGVTNYVVHSTATKESQVESINNFIISEAQKHPEFVGFGTMHPDFINFEEELNRIKSAGIKGLKLHPDFQRFETDDPKMDKIYEAAAQLELPILFHAGDYRFSFSGPKRIRNVIDKHPNLIVIAAHFGGYTEWDDALEYLCGQNVYFDTSSTLWKLPLEKANEIIKKHGYDKMLFGSDFPMWDHQDELSRFNTLNFTEAEKEAVLYTNAKKILKL